jgi:hypothetical protein
MPSDLIPATDGVPLSEATRQSGVEFLQGLMASGAVDDEQFHRALDQLLAADTATAMASVVRGLPAPVAMTPPSRQRQDALEISTAMGDVRLDGHWQVSRHTKITARMGSIIIDLRQAEFDDWDVEITAHSDLGIITVIVLPGMDVQAVGRNGPITFDIDPPIPGFPIVRLSATTVMGLIRVTHSEKKIQRRQRWWHRRQERKSQHTQSALGR